MTNRVTKALLGALFAAASSLTLPAMAQPVTGTASHGNMAVAAAAVSLDVSGSVSSDMPSVMPHMAGLAMANSVDSSATQAFKDANAKMHAAMDMGYSDDADVDFVRGMIAHHQGAVDMANAVLKYGTDPDVRMLAGDIVKAQEKEIDWMRNWLALHGPKDMSPSVTMPTPPYPAPGNVMPTADGATPATDDEAPASK